MRCLLKNIESEIKKVKSHYRLRRESDLELVAFRDLTNNQKIVITNENGAEIERFKKDINDQLQGNRIFMLVLRTNIRGDKK
jgi:hypothetical protein